MEMNNWNEESREIRIGPVPVNKTSRPWSNENSTLASTKSGGKIRLPNRDLPFFLSSYGLALQLFTQIAIIITIVLLWVFSNRNNGFVSAPGTPNSIFTGVDGIHSALLWTYALLWTALPGWIMTLYGALFVAMMTSLYSAQPIIELTRPEGERAGKKSTVKFTLLLDYTSGVLVFNWVIALLRRHFLIGFSMLVQLIVAFTPGLSSSILSVASVATNNLIPMTFYDYFDEYAPSNASTRPALDIVSANLINGGQPFAWTTHNHSLNPFSTAPASIGDIVTAETLAYSSTLNCSVISPEELGQAGNITMSDNGVNATYVTVTFDFVDRGCSLSHWLQVGPSERSYGATWAGTTCSISTYQGRIGLMSGQYNQSAPFLLSNFTLLSCIPSFWNSTASVMISSDNNGQMTQVTGSTMTSSTRRWPSFWDTWLPLIPYYQIYDPAQPWQMDTLAMIAHNYAKQQNANASFDSQLVSTSFQTAYTAVFAAFVSTSAYLPLERPTTTAGTLLQPQNRPFIVPHSAMVMIIIVALAFVMTIVVAVYVAQNKRRIAMSMSLILGHAILLNRSTDITSYIEHVKVDVMKAGGDVEESDLVDFASKSANLSAWECWLENGVVRMRDPEARKVEAV